MEPHVVWQTQAALVQLEANCTSAVAPSPPSGMRSSAIAGDATAKIKAASPEARRFII
jgi:hypothetical protein